MKKYYIGLIIIAVLSLGLSGYTVVQGVGAKQDNVTEERAQDIAKKLNNYVAKERKIPGSLEEAGIKDVPSTIKFEKTSEDTYKFCTTYKKASSYGFSDGITPLLSGGAIGRFEDQEVDQYSSDYESEYAAGSLYLSYYHKKGENCQKVKPYSLSSSRRNNNYPYDDYSDSFPEDMGGNYDFSSGDFGAGTSTTAGDTERQTDIKSMHGQIEAFYAQKGYYPSLANVNNSQWRATNLKGLDKEALRDPKGTGYTLATQPTANSYSYAATTSTGASCEADSSSCAKYTLTATLEKGGTYIKTSLN